jgi:hypothetical protein
MNMQLILQDQELWEEFCIACAMSSQLRPQVRFRYAIINSVYTRIWEECVWSELQSGNLIDAMSGFISDDLKKG